MKEKKLLNELFIMSNSVPGFIGYYHNSDGTKRWISGQSEIDTINTDNDYFLTLFKRKGDAANYAFKHKIGYKRNYDPASYNNNFDYICADSWYSSNYFYIQNVPGFGNKKVAFTLRIADHPVRAKSWFSPMFDRKSMSKQFVLNILIDPKVNNENFDKEYTDNFPLTVINAVYNPNNPNKEVDELVDNTLAGKQPIYDYKDILRMFGSNIQIDKYGNSQLYNNINFQERLNPQPKVKKASVKPTQKPLLTKIKKVWFEDDTFSGQSSITINIDGFDYTLYKPTIETIKDKEYYQLKIDNDYYVMDDDTGEVRKRRRDPDKLLPTPDRLTAPMATENTIKLTETDIKYMILECVKKIKKRLI